MIASTVALVVIIARAFFFCLKAQVDLLPVYLNASWSMDPYSNLIALGFQDHNFNVITNNYCFANSAG